MDSRTALKILRERGVSFDRTWYEAIEYLKGYVGMLETCAIERADVQPTSYVITCNDCVKAVVLHDKEIAESVMSRMAREHYMCYRSHYNCDFKTYLNTDRGPLWKINRTMVQSC